MPTSELITLGGFAFDVNGVPTPGPATRKARALMAFLVMHRDTDTARDRLLEIFWPDADPNHARDSLNTALWSIRRCIRRSGMQADECIVASKSTVRWTAATSVDAQRFAELAARDDDSASREALHLYRGDFLEGDYDNWAVTERERLAALYEGILARVVRTSKDAEAAQRFIARNPYDEEPYVTLIGAELASGRRAAAASWVERCRAALAEVGEKPSAAFETRFGNITHVEPLVPDELALPFAGREEELAFMASVLADLDKRQGGVTLVHGEAGIGKTALLNRTANLARDKGLRVVSANCAGRAARTFGPWEEVFTGVAAGDFDALVGARASDLTNAIAQAIADRLPEQTVVIVDDAHELSAESLDIFIALAEKALPRNTVIAGLRPEGVGLMRSRLPETSFQELPLGRLDKNDLKWALAQTLGNEQSDVLEILYERTRGHPLFFAGLLNSLVSAGTLARDGHRWHLTKPIDADIELPETVKRFIEARLHARGDAPRTVASALALELTARADDLIAVLHMEESAVLDALDDLLALGLIAQPESGVQFAFSHDLIREVAAEGLNAARRAALHRAFARRLAPRGELGVPLLLALHFRAAGESLLSAQSYLKSAQEALDLNAPHDAIERCDAGIREAERLEASPARDALLAKLHRTGARAAMAGGDAEDATSRARTAVSLARAAGDLEESMQALLDLAVMEGAAFHLTEQQSDAAEAGHSARLRGEVQLEAQALVVTASAARELGLRDEALRDCQTAHDLALKSGRSDVAQMALEELLRAQLTWWLFDDALETVRRGIDAARRAGPLEEASFVQARAALSYLLGRFDDALSDLQGAMRMTNQAVARRQGLLVAPMHPLPLLQFACHYLSAKIALARQDWERALNDGQRAADLTNVAKLPRHNEALSLLRIDTLLQRNLPGDRETVHELLSGLGERTLSQGIIGWSDCVELARARVAARLRMPEAGTLLRRALNTLEENSHRAPLEADRAFARLAEAAADIDDVVLAGQARARSKHYWSRRRAAAGASWGGELLR
jgi:DNA-binding SARP family transcriptional activator